MSERLRASRRLAPAAALALALSACGAMDQADAQTMRSVTSARQLTGEERRLEVEVEYGAGRLTVAPAEGSLLYRMEMRYDEERVRPVTAYDREAGRLRLGVESLRRREGSTRVNREHRADIALTPRVPLALDLKFGAGEADVELGGLSIERLDVETGASETTLRFSEPNRVAAESVRLSAGAAEFTAERLGNARAARYEFKGGLGDVTLDFGGRWERGATASVEMGVGSLTLRLPRELGVKITKDSFLTSFDAPGMVRRGNAWYSRGYDDARVKLDIEIDAAIGSIDVVWID